VPSWVDVVKTGAFRELAPYNDDWYYIRVAAVARTVYLRGGYGVKGLRHHYGGKKRRGVRPPHFTLGSGSIVRKALQALESIKVVESHPDGGRRITKIGRRDLDRIAQEVVSSQQQKQDEPEEE